MLEQFNKKPKQKKKKDDKFNLFSKEESQDNDYYISNNETSTQLPDQKGLRYVILKKIFSELKITELLKMGLVCKEWLDVCRDKQIWENHLKRDFYCLINDDYQNAVSVGPFKLCKEYSYEKDHICIQNLNQKLGILDTYDHPFLEYWRLTDYLFDIQSKHFRPKMSILLFIKVIVILLPLSCYHHHYI